MTRKAFSGLRPFELRRLYALLLAGAVFWSVAVGISLVTRIDDERRHTRMLAEKEGRANFDKDQAFRLWATAHGGVYVPANERTPPNPYLSHIPERDITTPSGRRLTLMNPAYMVRQMMEEYSDYYGVRGRITSLKPLNPNNRPDEWEARVLRAFEERDDVKEISEIVDLDGKPHLRLMRAMVTQKGCLKCHEHQGYRVGDIRGGVGVAVPLGPYLELQRGNIRKDMLLHGGLWLIGLAGLGAVGYTGRRGILARLLREEAESFRREGAEIKYAVAKALQETDWTFEDRMRVALAALNGLAGMAEDGGAEMVVDGRELGRRHFHHGQSFWRAAGRAMPEVGAGEVRVVPVCGQPGTPHGHYIVPLGHADEQLGVLVIDTVSHPPDSAIRLDALRQIGDLFALAILNDRADRLLREATARAEAASLSKSQFLATMSHEIRTPMNGILGMAQLLLMPALAEEERQEYARTILNSGQTLLALLNDILDISKIEAGKLGLARAAFDPEQIVRENVAIFAEPARSKGLRVEAAWNGPAGRRYMADPIRLRQMLSNLVANAIKFTAQGFVRVEAAEIERDGDRALLEFSVADSGIGIPAEKQPLLFEPFSQVDGSTTRTYGGTGLGLSIVRNLARLMGGGVGVESEAGKGARFWFRIRVDVLREGEESRHMQRGAETGPATGAASGLTGRALVVEDNAANRKVIEAMLKRLDVRADSVENGREAVDAVTRDDRPGLVLMDVQMPVMDGFEATAHIRRWERENGRPPLPIVALTAGVFEEDRRRCMEAGMDDFLAKPVNMDELAAVLSKWMGGGTPPS